MSKKLHSRIGIALSAALIALFAQNAAQAQEIEPEFIGTPEAGKLRTPEEVQRTVGTRLPERQFFQKKEYPALISLKEYAAIKAEAAAKRDPNGRTPGPELSALVPVPLIAPSLILANIEGVNQTTACGTCQPPDTHGAVGASHFVEATNFHLDIYSKTSPYTLTKSVSLASFLGYFTQTLFDPRVVYDLPAQRWIITAEAFNESTTIQRQFVAISKTNDPNGAFCVYNFDVDTLNNNDFWDYPQLGYNKDYVFMTANIFASVGSFKYGRMMRLPKSTLYNTLCPATTPTYYASLQSTLAPPLVPDTTSTNAYFVAAAASGIVYKYTNNGTSFTGPVNITIPAWSIPPSAPQPGGATLDTLDGRFQNASTQIGTSIFQTHTINSSGYATTKFYEFNGSTNTLVQSGLFYASATSHDYNPAIVANSAKDVFVVWSRSDSATFPQIRFSGRKVTDAAGVISAGSALFTSTVSYSTGGTPNRWGDYAAITVDPANTNQAWFVSEKVNSSTVWGTRIGKIGF